MNQPVPGGGEGRVPHRAKRSLGQNFLVDRGVQRRIVDALEAGSDAEVLEIGPGRGALTDHLAGQVRRLILVELDRVLAGELAVRFAGTPGVEVLQRDILTVDPTEVSEAPGELRVVGNIPYNLTTPILFHILEPPRPVVLVVMVQEEVADRIVAPPGGKTYGELAVGIRAVASVERLFRVPRGVFRPVPGVDSAVLRIVPLRPSPVLPEDEVPLRTLVRAAFQWRRKQLGTVLRDHPDLALLPGAGGAVLEEMGIDPRRRPETLAPEEYLALSRRLEGP